MKYKLVIVPTLLFLTACGDPRTTTGILIDVNEWTCTKTDFVAVDSFRMVGKVPVKETENKHICVQWTRMGK